MVTDPPGGVELLKCEEPQEALYRGIMAAHSLFHTHLGRVIVDGVWRTVVLKSRVGFRRSMEVFHRGISETVPWISLP